MPIGIVSDEDFNKELTRMRRPSDGPSDTIEQELNKLERGRGNVIEIHPSARALIGESALLEHNGDIAKTFGISRASVSAYKHGATSTASYNSPDEKLKEHITAAKTKIVRKASVRLMEALNSLKGKMNDVKPRDAAAIARDMSAVIKNMTEQEDNKNVQQVQFVVHTPPQKSESDYTAIQVNE